MKMKLILTSAVASLMNFSISVKGQEIDIIRNDRLLEKVEDYNNSFKADNKDEFFAISKEIQNKIKRLPTKDKKKLLQLDSTKCIVDKLVEITKHYLIDFKPITTEQTEFLIEIDKLSQLLQYGYIVDSNYSVTEISNLIEKERLVEKIENYDNSFKVDSKDEEHLKKRDEFFEISNKMQNAIMCLSAEEKKELSQLDSTKCIVDKFVYLTIGYLRGIKLITTEQTEFLIKIDTLTQLLKDGDYFDSNLESVIASFNSGLKHKLALINKPREAKKAREARICKAR